MSVWATTRHLLQFIPTTEEPVVCPLVLYLGADPGIVLYLTDCSQVFYLGADLGISLYLPADTGEQLYLEADTGIVLNLDACQC